MSEKHEFERLRDLKIPQLEVRLGAIETGVLHLEIDQVAGLKEAIELINARLEYLEGLNA